MRQYWHCLTLVNIMRWCVTRLALAVGLCCCRIRSLWLSSYKVNDAERRYPWRETGAVGGHLGTQAVAVLP